MTFAGGHRMDFHIPFSRIFTLIQMHLHGESFYFVNGTKASNQFPSTGLLQLPSAKLADSSHIRQLACLKKAPTMLTL